MSVRKWWPAAALTTVALGLTPGVAQAEALHTRYVKAHDAATEKFGADTVGRNIVVNGQPGKGNYRGQDGSRAPKREEIIESWERMNRWLNPPKPVPQPVAQQTTPQEPVQPVQQQSGGGASAGLEAIAQCESGGDPGAIGGGGKYRGKYQFSQETWNSVGGSGDPAAAPEAEQDKRAAQLLAEGGAGHWPVCGK